MSADSLLRFLSDQTKYYDTQAQSEQDRQQNKQQVDAQNRASQEASFLQRQADQSAEVKNKESAIREKDTAYSEAALRNQLGYGPPPSSGDSVKDSQLRNQLGFAPEGVKPTHPLENYLGGVTSQDDYRTSMMQYISTGGKRPKWYTGNFEVDKPNIDAAISSTMTPMQQIDRENAKTRIADLKESKDARIELAKKAQDDKTKEDALKREGLEKKAVIAKREERLQAHTVIAGILGAEAINIPEEEINAIATRLASRAKTKFDPSEGGDFEEALQNEVDGMIAAGELKLPEPSTGLGKLGSYVGLGTAKQDFKFNSRGAEPQAAATPVTQGRPTPNAGHMQYLKAHPEFKEQFKAKFGYLP